ncbi:MAG: hypothetical protein ACTSRY_04645, partial [Alphaproteobacteria bacterium]
TTMISFELHTYLGGNWKIDSIFDDRALAMSEAKRIEERGRTSAVRVVEEIYDEITRDVQSRTIYRSTKLDKQNSEAIQRQAENKREIKSITKKSVGRERIAKQKVEKRKAKAQGQYVMLVMKLGVIVLIGVSLLVVLRMFAEGA